MSRSKANQSSLSKSLPSTLPMLNGLVTPNTTSVPIIQGKVRSNEGTPSIAIENSCKVRHCPSISTFLILNLLEVIFKSSVHNVGKSWTMLPALSSQQETVNNSLLEKKLTQSRAVWFIQYGWGEKGEKCIL